MKRRHFLLIGLPLLSMNWIPCIGLAEIISTSDAINKSGRQRMLSQRIAKAYIQLGLGVDLEQSRKILDTSIAIFDKQLIELKVFATTPEIKNQLQQIEKLWLTYKETLIGHAPNLKDARQIFSISDNLLHACDEATQKFEAQANSKLGKLVNISGRQRMLSQRMAKLYQAEQWKVTGPEAQREIKLLRNEFIENMEVLEKSSASNRHLNDELKLAKQQWVYFDYALRQQGESKLSQQFATTVATTSERILEQMDIVTGIYQTSKIEMY